MTAETPEARRTRVAVFTAGAWSFDRDRILRAILSDREFEVVLILVDQYRRSPLERARFLRRVWGTRTLLLSLALSVVQRMQATLSALAWRFHDRVVGRPRAIDSLKVLADEHGLRVEHVADINAPDAVRRVADAKADIAIILGGRILRPPLLQASRLGTLNIHKHDVTRYRGGPEIGYPEIANRDAALGVTVHWATADVDAGPVVATHAIPIQTFDTIESLKLKAASDSIALYARALRQACAPSAPASPSGPLGPILYSTPPIDRFMQTTRIDRARRRFARSDATLGLSPIRVRAMRAARGAATFLALPYLARRRDALAAAGHSPIMIFYYHGLGNAAENWMTLDLAAFHRQAEYLLKYFDVLSLEDAVLAQRSGRSGRPAAVLTFDDGYLSNLRELAPYLVARGLPATFFVCGAAAGGGYTMPHDVKRGFGAVPLMDASGWRALSGQGFDIGCHGFAHEDMATLNEEQLRHAMIASADLIATHIGKPVRYFSFPFGNRRNISELSLAVARQRFDAVFSASGGYNIPGLSDSFCLTRFSNPADLGSMIAIANGFHRSTPFYYDPA
jgi:peptidoglycan/xylan/chitin deacetylase (PgdA/CDA1 family)/folate-dependent phosphoribosylglycinamide formyltransferase PurN